MFTLFKQQIWKRILLILAIIMLLLGPVIFREARDVIEFEPAATTVVSGPIIDQHGTNGTAQP